MSVFHFISSTSVASSLIATLSHTHTHTWGSFQYTTHSIHSNLTQQTRFVSQPQLSHTSCLAPTPVIFHTCQSSPTHTKCLQLNPAPSHVSPPARNISLPRTFIVWVMLLPLTSLLGNRIHLVHLAFKSVLLRFFITSNGFISLYVSPWFHLSFIVVIVFLLSLFVPEIWGLEGMSPCFLCLVKGV